MAIGNPINLTSNVEGKNISVIATAGQTQFTVTGGYRINQISVFRNGVRLVDGRDFTALDGSIVTLLSAATVADVIEFQVFDDFRVSDALSVNSGGTVNGNVTVTGILSTTNLSIGSSISLDATTGIITAVQVIGGTITGTATTAINAQGLTGTPDITVNNIVAAAATFSGVVTYEDVTNIDSLGIVTARTGVDITANGLVVNAGVSTFGADLSIADKIIHSGDTNTAIRFPSNDTFTVETSGVQRLEVDSTGDLGLVGIATATGLVVVAGSGVYAGHTGIITAVTFDGALSGAASQVTVADESSDTTCFPLFATAATGDLAPKSGTNLTFNSSSGALTATSFVGALTGAVTGNADTATNASGLTGTPNIDCGTGSFTGDVDIADKIVHTGDTDTAIRFPAADTFTVETGGSENARFTSSAITFKAPDGGNRYNFGELGNSAHAELSLYNSSDAQKVRIAANNDTFFDGGDVSIGSQSPLSGAELTVAGKGIAVTGQNGAHSANSIRIGEEGSGVAQIRCYGPDASTNGSLTLRVSRSDGSNSQDVTIDSSGRLLIGTTTEGLADGDNLTIADSGSCGITLRSGSSSGGAIYFSDATSGSGEYEGFVEYLHNDNALRFASGGTERLRINSSGNLLAGHGTAADSNNKIEISNAFGGRMGFLRSDTSTAAGNNIGMLSFFGNDSNGTYQETARISAEADLDHGDNDKPGRLLFYTTADGASSVTERLRIDSSGNSTFTGTVSDSKGELRSIPQNSKSTAYTLVAADAGKHVLNTADVTVPASVFAAGNAITIINGSGSNINITQGSGATIYYTADGTSGSRVLAARGMASMLFVNSTDCYISGAGLS